MRSEGPARGRLADAAATNRRLLSASSLTFASRAFAKAAQVIFLVVAARFLSIEEFASYSYVVAVATAFTVVSDTGVPLISSRDMAAGKGRPMELFWAAVPVVAASAAIAAVVLAAFGFADSGPGTSAGPVLAAVGFVLANRAFDFLATTLRGLGRFGLEAGLQAAGAAGFIVLGVIAAAAGAGVGTIVALLLAKELGCAAVAYLALRSEVGGPRRPAPGAWRPLLRAGIGLALAGTALALVMRLPLTLLGNSGTAGEVAAFSAAQRFADAGVLLTTTAGFALLPGIAHLAARDPERVRRLLLLVTGGLLAAAVVAAGVGIPLAGPLLGTVFGEDFRPGADALRVLLAGLPAYVLLGVCWYALVALGGERHALRIGLAGLTVGVVCGVVLIPAHGEVGAAVAYVAPLAVMAAGSAVLCARRVRVPALTR